MPDVRPLDSTHDILVRQKQGLWDNPRFEVSGNPNVIDGVNNRRTLEEGKLFGFIEDENSENSIAHVCFLIHGHRGTSEDLSYLQHSIKGAAKNQMKNSKSSTKGHTSRTSSSQQKSCQKDLTHEVYIHTPTCNEGKTFDGVINCGERLAEEMLSVMSNIAKRKRAKGQRELVDVTLSIIGNSLGGLFARYAITALAEMSLPSHSSVDSYKNGIIYPAHGVRIHYNIFCTAASPHLGVSKHTWIRTPRAFEVGLGNFLSLTGRDVFRVNDLVLEMGTSMRFLNPLRAFKKRVAYANSYRTDYPVSTATAALLCPTSDYPHQCHEFELYDGPGDSRRWGRRIDKDGKPSFVVGTFETQPNPSIADSPPTIDKWNFETFHDVKAMSNSLDSLGWKKVFVDLRGELAGVTMPRFHSTRSIVQRAVRKAKSGTADGLIDVFEDDISPTPEEILKQRLSLSEGEVESRHLHNTFNAWHFDYRLPWGHSMICALRLKASKKNLGGSRVIDHISDAVVHEILQWETDKR